MTPVCPDCGTRVTGFAVERSSMVADPTRRQPRDISRWLEPCGHALRGVANDGRGLVVKIIMESGKTWENPCSQARNSASQTR